LVSDSRLARGILDDIEIYKIFESPNPLRPNTEEIDELALSIKQKGLLQPIVVRPSQENFEVVAGNRRYKACKKIGWKMVTCHIVELDDKEAFEISLIENVQRRTLNPLEEAEAYRIYVSDFGWGGVSELAERLGKSPSYITRRIRLLDLPSDVLNSITGSEISTSVAEELCSVRDKSRQSELAGMISRRHLSIKQTREILREGHTKSDDAYSLYLSSNSDRDEKTHRIFDKSITALRIAMNRIGTLVESMEDDWVVHEILMYHNNMLHTQIDLLLKHKRRYNCHVPLVTLKQ
jgi:ParB family chromosome partitioning protein